MTKRPFTSRIEVFDVVAICFLFFRRDWVGVQCTLVQDRKECIPSEMPKRRNEEKKKERF